MLGSKKPNQGYIALITAVIISVLLLTMTVSLNLSQFLARTNSLDREFKEISFNLAEACVDDATIRLAKNEGLLISPPGIVVPVNSLSCAIFSIEVGVGNTNIIKTQGSFQNTYTNLEVTIATTSNSITQQSFQELPTF